MSNDEERFFEIKIDASSLKMFSAGLHLVQKIGKDLILEVEETVLTFRSLNENKSSFASLEFKSDFFDEYELFSSDAFACKLPIKPVCVIMRNLRSVQHIVLSAIRTGAQHELFFRFQQQNRLVRTMRFTYMDCEVMNPVFREDDCSLLQLRPRLLAHVLQNMHRSPEIVLHAAPQTLSIKSHFPPEVLLKDYRFVMNTGMTINPQELEVFEFRSHDACEELVFCVKEVVAFLAFCEAMDVASFQMFFSRGGSAIKFSGGEDLVHVSLVMATIEQTQRVHNVEDEPHVETPQRDTLRAQRTRVQGQRDPHETRAVEERRPAQRLVEDERESVSNSVLGSQQIREASHVLKSFRSALADEASDRDEQHVVVETRASKPPSEEEDDDDSTVHERLSVSEQSDAEDRPNTAATPTVPSTLPATEALLTSMSPTVDQPRQTKQTINRRKRFLMDESDESD